MVMDTLPEEGFLQAVLDTACDRFRSGKQTYEAIVDSMSGCSGAEAVVVIAGSLALFSRFTRVRVGEGTSTGLDLVSEGAAVIGRRTGNTLRRLGSIVL